MFGDTYIKTKVKSYNKKITTVFHSKALKEGIKLVCLSEIVIDSFFKFTKFFYLQTFLEECKYKRKRKGIKSLVKNGCSRKFCWWLWRRKKFWVICSEILVIFSECQILKLSINKLHERLVKSTTKILGMFWKIFVMYLFDFCVILLVLMDHTIETMSIQCMRGVVILEHVLI